jgi:glutathione peroxidase
MSESIYDIELESLTGERRLMREHAGKVVLVVNTASKCGYTPQYAGLEELHKKYRDRGLVVLGFPCNQFGFQEPGDEAAIGAFCERNYGVSFPMHAKIDVRGKNQHALYKHLTHEKRGVLGSRRIKWNFTKFLVDRQGNVVGRFGPRTTPEELTSEIEKLL